MSRLTTSVFAADIQVDFGAVGNQEPASYTDFGRLLANLYLTLVIITGIFAFINLALAGFQYVTGGGEKAALEQARNKITYSIMGLVLVVGAFAFAQIIKFVFGVNLIGAIKWPTPP